LFEAVFKRSPMRIQSMAGTGMLLSLLPWRPARTVQPMPPRRRERATRSRAKTIVLLGAPSTQILDVAGPFQIFVRAAELYVKAHPGQPSPYAVLLASTTRRASVSTNCGLALAGGISYRQLRGPIDTLLVAGGSGVQEASHDAELVEWLRKVAPRVRRLGSVCTGAFILAGAGLLEGKRAATHWKWADDLAAQYRDTTVDPDPIYIRDGNTYTTAGVTAGMDLALALVEEDLGSPLALSVAREMVLYLRRAGGQSQFSASLALQATDRKQIAELRAWVLDNIDRDLRVDALAAQARMSPRHFARVFHHDTGTTPAQFVERVRVEAARRRLEESRDKLNKVASDCGFGSIQSLRRAFSRVLQVSPNDYRSRFRDMRSA
jgi:transcriptional regulator GlxA family with amidase domain